MSRSRRHRSPHGFTLIEALVMGSVGLMVVGTIWYMVVSFGRRSQELDHRLQSFQAAQVVLAQIRKDMMRFHPMENLSMVGDLKHRLSVPVASAYTYDPEQPTKNHLQVQIVTYEFDPSDHRLRRSGDALRLGRFEDVNFELIETADPSARDEDEPIPDVRNYLKVNLVCAPEGRLGDPELRDRDRITYGAVFPLWAKSYHEAFPLAGPLP